MRCEEIQIAARVICGGPKRALKCDQILASLSKKLIICTPTNTNYHSTLKCILAYTLKSHFSPSLLLPFSISLQSPFSSYLTFVLPGRSHLNKQQSLLSGLLEQDGCMRVCQKSHYKQPKVIENVFILKRQQRVQ